MSDRPRGRGNRGRWRGNRRPRFRSRGFKGRGHGPLSEPDSGHPDNTHFQNSLQFDHPQQSDYRQQPLSYEYGDSQDQYRQPLLPTPYHYRQISSSQSRDEIHHNSTNYDPPQYRRPRGSDRLSGSRRWTDSRGKWGSRGGWDQGNGECLRDCRIKPGSINKGSLVSLTDDDSSDIGSQSSLPSERGRSRGRRRRPGQGRNRQSRNGRGGNNRGNSHSDRKGYMNNDRGRSSASTSTHLHMETNVTVEPLTSIPVIAEQGQRRGRWRSRRSSRYFRRGCSREGNLKKDCLERGSSLSLTDRNSNELGSHSSLAGDSRIQSMEFRNISQDQETPLQKTNKTGSASYLYHLNDDYYSGILQKESKTGNETEMVKSCPDLIVKQRKIAEYRHTRPNDLSGREIRIRGRLNKYRADVSDESETDIKFSPDLLSQTKIADDVQTYRSFNVGKKTCDTSNSLKAYETTEASVQDVLNKYDNCEDTNKSSTTKSQRVGHARVCSNTVGNENGISFKKSNHSVRSANTGNNTATVVGQIQQEESYKPTGLSKAVDNGIIKTKNQTSWLSASTVSDKDTDIDVTTRPEALVTSSTPFPKTSTLMKETAIFNTSQCTETAVQVNPNSESRENATFVQSRDKTIPICDDQHLCEKHIWNTCPDRNKCPHYHGYNTVPYQWQYLLSSDGWSDFQDDANDSTEVCFSSLKSYVPKLNLTRFLCVDVDLDHMTAQACIKVRLGLLSERMRVRRLSTRSYSEGDGDLSLFTFWCWYWKDDQDIWLSYDSPEMQYTLERKYMFGQREYHFERERFHYMITFGKTEMYQTNIDTGKRRQVIRRPPFVSKHDVQQKCNGPPSDVLQMSPQAGHRVPQDWVPLDLVQPFEKVQLDPNTKAYIDIKQSFYATMDEDRYSIITVFRLQNPSRWNTHCSYKLHMEHTAKIGRFGSNVEERMLFHGTNTDVIRGICVNGFDFRVCGKNGTRYGKGAYFATRASYSTSYAGSGKTKHMFLARVLVGQYTEGNPDLTRPPVRKRDFLYDSCVDNVACPKIFVSFHQDQAYPEYLIQYEDNMATHASTKVRTRQPPNSNLATTSATNATTIFNPATRFPTTSSTAGTGSKYSAPPSSILKSTARPTTTPASAGSSTTQNSQKNAEKKCTVM